MIGKSDMSEQKQIIVQPMREWASERIAVLLDARNNAQRVNGDISNEQLIAWERKIGILQELIRPV